MILPTKHIQPERSLLGVGAEVLRTLQTSMTISKLWNELRARRSVAAPNAPIDYRWFVLALDFLFMVGAVTWGNGLISKVSK